MTIKEKVENILKNSELSRNNDHALLVNYWKIYDKINVYENMKLDIYDIIDNTTPAVSIIRARSYIQNTEKKYLPTRGDVLRGRKMKETKMREVYKVENV